MLKKIMAIMLAAVMLLLPVAAFAVTWSDVVSSLQGTGSFSSEETAGSQGEAGDVIPVESEEGEPAEEVEQEAETSGHDGADYARTRHQMEELRKQQAIGGVYASPYWLKQLNLGYSPLELRLYEDGEHILFKESLSWKDGGPEKRLTLRANVEGPQALTMRLDGAVIDVLERTEITVITLVDYNGQLYMEYNVSDLKGARGMYGLERGDLLCVGNADAEVMKIGADGQMVPVEQGTEVATDGEATAVATDGEAAAEIAAATDGEAAAEIAVATDGEAAAETAVATDGEAAAE